jgi:predicted dehydrogenase
MVGFNRPLRAGAAEAVQRVLSTASRPRTVSFRFASGYIPGGAWPQDEDIGGGRIVGEACHAIDTCVAITGSPPVRVFAESIGMAKGLETTDDQVFITVRHEDGSVSNVSYQAGGDRAAPTERIEVYGGGRTAVVEGWDRARLWRGEKLTEEKFGPDRGNAACFEAFVEAVRRGGGDWPVPWAEVYASASATLAAVESLRSGLPVDLRGPAEEA